MPFVLFAFHYLCVKKIPLIRVTSVRHRVVGVLVLGKRGGSGGQGIQSDSEIRDWSAPRELWRIHLPVALDLVVNTASTMEF